MFMHQVPLFGQKYNMSCWAASIRMILAAAGVTVADDDAIAAPTGHANSLRTGLNPTDAAPLRQWGFVMEAPQTYTEAGIAQLVNTHGPLWIACDVRNPGSSRSFPHIRVIRGVRNQQNPFAVAINDPWPVAAAGVRGGAQYDETYTDMVRKNELLGSTEANISSPIYVAYRA